MLKTGDGVTRCFGKSPISCEIPDGFVRKHFTQDPVTCRMVERARINQNRCLIADSSPAGPTWRSSSCMSRIRLCVTGWEFGRISWCFASSESSACFSRPPTLSKPSSLRTGFSSPIRLHGVFVLTR
uniref:(northern house mosquito) hypothetical protein n=1 Tax=Culex pipiens TaxID=7175 RepID=A0A8D8BZF9_CULPI